MEFVQYNDGRSYLSVGKFEKMMTDIGVCVDKADIGKCFNFFNVAQNGKMSLEEYSLVLSVAASDES